MTKQELVAELLKHPVDDIRDIVQGVEDQLPRKRVHLYNHWVLTGFHPTEGTESLRKLRDFLLGLYIDTNLLKLAKLAKDGELVNRMQDVIDRYNGDLVSYSGYEVCHFHPWILVLKEIGFTFDEKPKYELQEQSLLGYPVAEAGFCSP